MTVSDAPICGITYDCHSDNSRVVIYNNNIFIIQATDHRRLVPTNGLLFESKICVKLPEDLRHLWKP